MKKNDGGVKRHYFNWLNNYIKPYKGYIVVSSFSSVITAAFNIFKVYLIMIIIESILLGNHQRLNSIIIISILFFLAGIVCSYLTKYASGRLALLVIRDIRKVLSENLVRIPINDLDKNHSGDMISTVNNDMGAIEDFLQNDYNNCIYQPIMFIGSFIFMLFINWKLLLVSFCLTPLAIYTVNKLSGKIKIYSKEYYELLSEANIVFQDTIKGMTVVKTFNLHKELYSKYKEKIKNNLSLGLQIEKRKVMILPVTIIIYELPFVLSVLYGGIMCIRGELQPAKLIAFIQLLGYVIQPLVSFPRLIAKIHSTVGAIQRVCAVLEIREERSQGEICKINYDEKIIEFNNVSFGYRSNQKILNDLNFHIIKGQKIGVVGYSGSGKSTIMNLICGFNESYDGTIKISGKDINDLNLNSLRDNISIVYQDMYFFPDTIAENIRYGRLDATMNDIYEAAMKANIHECIMGFSKGYDTKIGEGGVNLSGGQKQRLAIARAILKNAPILLLDEPTSALDGNSDQLIQNAIENFDKDCTLMIIAHRLSTIKNVEKILVVDKGRIIESGTHEELMSKNGFYKQLYLKQVLL